MTGDLSDTQESAAPEPADSAAALSARLLEEEALREQRTTAMLAELTDEQMPGVGLDEMSLRQGLKIGGISMVVVLGLAQFVEWIDRSGVQRARARHPEDARRERRRARRDRRRVRRAVLRRIDPDQLARRPPLTHEARRGLDRRLVGHGGRAPGSCRTRSSSSSPGSGAVSASRTSCRRTARCSSTPTRSRPGPGSSRCHRHADGRTGLAPFIAGAIAAIVGGDEGWRWVFLVTAIAAVPSSSRPRGCRTASAAATRCRPCSARSSTSDADELPISLGVAFERLRRIRTFYFFLLGMAALGFALFSVPLFLNLLLEDRFGLDGFDRGLLPRRRDRARVDRGRVRRASAPTACSASSPPRSLVFIGGAHRRRSACSSPSACSCRTSSCSVIFVAIGTALAAVGRSR